MPQSLVDLEQQRGAIFEQMLRLPDFRSGSITTTRGTRGKPNCQCISPTSPEYVSIKSRKRGISILLE